MIPVDQSLFGLGGNCMAACIASILEVPLDAVPCAPFVEGRQESQQWRERWLRWQAWLVPINLTLVELPSGYMENPPCGYSIMGVRSTTSDPRDPAKKLIHAVVAIDGICVHDPSPTNRVHPERSYKPIDYTVFALRDPVAPVQFLKRVPWYPPLIVPLAVRTKGSG